MIKAQPWAQDISKLKSKAMTDKRLPENFKPFDGGDIISNFDGLIENKVAEAIKDKPLYGTYPGWNFYGTVWYQDGKWCCEIKQYLVYKGTIEADTLEELRDEVCDIFGYD